MDTVMGDNTPPNSESDFNQDNEYHLVSIDELRTDLPDCLSDDESESQPSDTISFLEAMNQLYQEYNSMSKLKHLLVNTPDSSIAKPLVRCAVYTQLWLRSKRQPENSEVTAQLQSEMIVNWNQFIVD
jgi:hypothetical protein